MRTKRGLDVDNVWLIFKEEPAGMGHPIYRTTVETKIKYLSLYTTKAHADLFLESAKVLGDRGFRALKSPGAAGLLDLLTKSQSEKVEHFTFNAMPSEQVTLYPMQEIIDDVKEALVGDQAAQTG
jgi:hypothetical protein